MTTANGTRPGEKTAADDGPPLGRVRVNSQATAVGMRIGYEKKARDSKSMRRNTRVGYLRCFRVFKEENAMFAGAQPNRKPICVPRV